MMKDCCLNVNKSRVGGEVFCHYQQLNCIMAVDGPSLKYKRHPRKPALFCLTVHSALSPKYYFKRKRTFMNSKLIIVLMSCTTCYLKGVDHHVFLFKILKQQEEDCKMLSTTCTHDNTHKRKSFLLWAILCIVLLCTILNLIDKCKKKNLKFTSKLLVDKLCKLLTNIKFKAMTSYNGNQHISSMQFQTVNNFT